MAQQCILRNTPLQKFLSSKQSCCPVVILLDSSVEAQGSLQEAEEGKFSSDKREW